MRDLAAKWPRVPDWQTAVLETHVLSIRTLSGLNQYVVSGDLEAWRRHAAMPGPGIGALAVAGGDPYAVRLARDRILLTGGDLPHLASGWNEQGFAVTGIGDGLHVFEITGPSLPDLLARATSLDQSTPGPCAAILFAGVNAVAYRYKNAGTLRVHVDRGLATYLWTWFNAAVPTKRSGI